MRISADFDAGMEQRLRLLMSPYTTLIPRRLRVAWTYGLKSTTATSPRRSCLLQSHSSSNELAVRKKPIEQNACSWPVPCEGGDSSACLAGPRHPGRESRSVSTTESCPVSSSDFNCRTCSRPPRSTNANETRPLLSGAIWCSSSPKGHDNEGKLADLAEIDGRQQAGAQPLLEQVERHKGRDEPARHRKQCEQQRPHNERSARNRDRHAETNEKQRDEKVPKAGHFCSHIERVGKSGNRNACDERSHFAGELHSRGKLTDKKAPRQRADEHQFRKPRDAAEKRRAAESG